MTSKRSVGKICAHISSRLFIMYTAIFILICIGLFNLLSFRVDSSLNFAEESLRSVSMSVNNTAKNAVNHVRILQTAARQHLLEPPSNSPHELLSGLAPDAAGDSYSLQTLPPIHRNLHASYVVGGGNIPAFRSEKAQELEAALKLNPLFADVKNNVSDSTWIYYYSSNRFINMYPFEPQALPWSEDWMTHPLFVYTQPDKNPTRSIRWHEVYQDEAGKGLMTSIVAPVFDDQDRFRAMVGIDYTLNTMANHLTGPGLSIGTPLLVDRQGHVLASPTAIHVNDKVVISLNEVLPSELRDLNDTLLELTPGSFHDLAGWKILVMDIDSAPWRLFFLVDHAQLRWRTLCAIWAEIVGILLLLIVFCGFEQRHRRRKQRQAEKELAQLDRLHLVGEIAAGIGHEIRNPLAAVRGFLQLIEQKPHYQDHKDVFHLMIDELDRANRIITEFLNLAKDKAIQSSPHQLNDLVQTFLPILQSEASLRGNELLFIPGNVPTVMVDEKELRQVLLNLTMNGLEAMQGNGILTIKTFQDNNSIILSISDQGDGIPDEAISQIGRPFFTTKPNGTGLGLSICFAIASRHGARLTYDTSPKGATFYLIFPLENMI